MADEVKTCVGCGHNQATGAFCEVCGTKLPVVAAAAPTPPSAPMAAPIPPAPMAAPAAPPEPAPFAPPPYPAGYHPPYPQVPSPFMDYMAFRKMLTPGIAQIAFWLFEGLNLFYWIRMIYYGHRSALEVIFSLVGLFVTALLIRILMETVVTIFKTKS